MENWKFGNQKQNIGAQHYASHVYVYIIWVMIGVTAYLFTMYTVYISQVENQHNRIQYQLIILLTQ